MGEKTPPTPRTENVHRFAIFDVESFPNLENILLYINRFQWWVDNIDRSCHPAQIWSFRTLCLILDYFWNFGLDSDQVLHSGFFGHTAGKTIVVCTG